MTGIEANKKEPIERSALFTLIMGPKKAGQA